MFLKGEFSNRLVQVSLFAGIVYYITAYPVVFESARKYFPIKFKKTHHLLIFHTFVFAVLMYLLTYFVFDPIVRVVEGSTGGVVRVETGSWPAHIGWKCKDTNLVPVIRTTDSSYADCKRMVRARVTQEDYKGTDTTVIEETRQCIDENNNPGEFYLENGSAKCRERSNPAQKN